MDVVIPALDPVKYGQLCSEALPVVIRSESDFERLAAKMEAIHFKEHPTREEIALAEVLARLVQDYDVRHATELSNQAQPGQVLSHLMESREMTPADLVAVFGSRSAVANALAGKREISPAEARKLGELFELSPAAFI